MSTRSDAEDDDETTLSQLLLHSSATSGEYSSSDSDEDEDDTSDNDDSSDSDELSSSSSEEEPPDIVAQVGNALKAAVHAVVGTRESRFASRTNTTLKWKADVAYEQAKAQYIAQKVAAAEAEVAAVTAQRLDVKRVKKSKLQAKANRKMRRKMDAKIAACDVRHRKLDAKMTIVSEIRLHRLNVDAGYEPGFIGHVRKPPALAQAVSAPVLRPPPPISEIEKSTAHTHLAQERASTLVDAIDAADAIGRQCGMLPALRTPPPVVRKDELETTTVLLLRLAPPRPPEPDGRAHKLKSLFTVNLKRFRHVEKCTGDRIGERGAVELGKSLLTGACPRLHELNLAWNDIKLRGVTSLAEAFAQGACGQLTTLDLRANSLNAASLQLLLDALGAGGLPKLLHLVFAGNAIGDRGGKAVAHAFLQGALRHLATIDLKSNMIKSDGCRAIFNAFTADCFDRFGPSLQLIDLRRNQITQAAALTFVPCPKHISF
ncbi:hypothetical protein ACHHYP_00600 [Achlya hypogyna]|uniref:Uncharacterized protein n=1 Tax=Achlya hypogyna TaxID=1202772 RepID=A0A1V9ZUE4_ACHHY|nr:hypothetical protein ACHHYP_00600 [Achlya hypogyna]